MEVIRLLILDIDGVLALEVEPPMVDQSEILRLHRNLDKRLAGLGLPIMVLTHRSKREAMHILQQVGLTKVGSDDVIAAEDLFRAALRGLRLHAMVRGGLLKSLIVTTVLRRRGVRAGEIAFVDDKRTNLEDLSAAGIGRVFLAPSSVDAEAGLVEGFLLDDLIARLRAAEQPHQGIARLASVSAPIAEWQRTGMNTGVHGHHAFNTFRRVARAVRLLLAGQRR